MCKVLLVPVICFASTPRQGQSSHNYSVVLHEVSMRKSRQLIVWSWHFTNASAQSKKICQFKSLAQGNKLYLGRAPRVVDLNKTVISGFNFYRNINLTYVTMMSFAGRRIRYKKVSSLVYTCYK